MSRNINADDDAAIDRRQYVKLAGTGLVAASTGVAGCASSPESEGTEGDGGGDDGEDAGDDGADETTEPTEGTSGSWTSKLGTDREYWMVMSDVAAQDRFFPSTLFVQQGDSVGIHAKNTGEEPHDFEIPAFGVKAEEVPQEETVTRTFTANEAGVHPIECELHPQWMYGQLVVLPSSGEVPTTNDRTLRIAMSDVAKRDSFFPSTNVVVEGEEVAIKSENTGDEPHDFEIPAFDVVKEEVAAGEGFETSFTADTPGIHAMECELHPKWMYGQLIVLPADGDFSRIEGGDARKLRMVMGDVAKRDSFFPSTNVVKKGEEVQVQLKNTGDEPHDMDIEPFDVEVELDAGKEKELSFTADEAGVHQIVCELHPPEMNGQLWVVP